MSALIAEELAQSAKLRSRGANHSVGKPKALTVDGEGNHDASP